MGAMGSVILFDKDVRIIRRGLRFDFSLFVKEFGNVVNSVLAVVSACNGFFCWISTGNFVSASSFDRFHENYWYMALYNRSYFL